MKSMRILKALLVMLTACGSSDNEVSQNQKAICGTWFQYDDGFNVTITFKEDGTFSEEVVAVQGYQVTTNSSGTYKIDGDKFTINWSTYGEGTEYTISFDTNTMTWSTEDSSRVFTKVVTE